MRDSDASIEIVVYSGIGNDCAVEHPQEVTMRKPSTELVDSAEFAGVLGPSRRTRQRNQLGAGHTKAIVVTIALVLAVYAGWRLIPPFINDYQLHDKLVEEARYASVNHRTDDELRGIVFQEIQDLGIPAHPEDIKIDNLAHSVRITVDYTVPVDVLGYHAVLHFTPTSENKALT